MEENNHIPRLLDAKDIYAAEHDIIADTMEWAFDEDKDRSAETLNYIFGMYDLAQTLLRRIEGK